LGLNKGTECDLQTGWDTEAGEHIRTDRTRSHPSLPIVVVSNASWKMPSRLFKKPLISLHEHTPGAFIYTSVLTVFGDSSNKTPY